MKINLFVLMLSLVLIASACAPSVAGETHPTPVPLDWINGKEITLVSYQVVQPTDDYALDVVVKVGWQYYSVTTEWFEYYPLRLTDQVHQLDDELITPYELPQQFFFMTDIVEVVSGNFPDGWTGRAYVSSPRDDGTRLEIVPVFEDTKNDEEIIEIMANVEKARAEKAQAINGVALEDGETYYRQDATEASYTASTITWPLYEAARTIPGEACRYLVYEFPYWGYTYDQYANLVKLCNLDISEFQMLDELAQSEKARKDIFHAFSFASISSIPPRFKGYIEDVCWQESQINDPYAYDGFILNGEHQVTYDDVLMISGGYTLYLFGVEPGNEEVLGAADYSLVHHYCSP